MKKCICIVPQCGSAYANFTMDEIYDYEEIEYEIFKVYSHKNAPFYWQKERFKLFFKCQNKIRKEKLLKLKNSEKI